MYNTFPFLVHSSTPREITFTVPGNVEEEATLPTSKIGHEILEYIRRRCKYGDFPIAFAVRIKGNPSKPEDYIPDHYNSWTIPPPPPFKELDFRAITRNPERARTTITVDMGYIYGQVKWITAGQVDLSGPDDRGVSTLKAHLPAGVTDFEHDSSYAFCLDLIGVRFRYSGRGTSLFEGFLHPDIETFKVPSSDYNPMESDEAWMCDHCDKPHPMLPEGLFTPKATEDGKKLFHMLRKFPLTITIGPTPPTGDGEAGYKVP